jgi:hypothetical protein
MPSTPFWPRLGVGHALRTGVARTSDRRSLVSGSGLFWLWAIAIGFGAPAEAQFRHPVDNPSISCVFDDLACYESGKYHTGLDYSSDAHSVYAAAPGTVVKMQVNGEGCAPGCNTKWCGCLDHGLGNTVVIRHDFPGETLYTLYAHLSSFASGLYVNKNVAQGTVLGQMGQTGFGVTPWELHVHFELKTSGVLENPSGVGTYYGYTPSSALAFGYLDPVARINNAGRVAGDWNGDGIDHVWTFSGGQWTIPAADTGTAQLQFTMGIPGDLPVVGDWNGDGRDDPGVFRASQSPSTFYLDINHDAAAEWVLPLSGSYPQDIPVAGDWDGDGDGDIGAWDKNTRTFYLFRITGPSSWIDLASYQIGNPGDLPVVGNWDGLGGDEIGVFRPGDASVSVASNNFYFRKNDGTVVSLASMPGGKPGGWGNLGDLPLVGDWNKDGFDTVGLYRPNTREIFTDNSLPKFAMGQPPTVVITTPTTADTYDSSLTPLVLRGTASDADGVTQVWWVNNRGGSGSATGTADWTVSVALQSGVNVITLTARDGTNNTGTDTLTVTLTGGETWTQKFPSTSPVANQMIAMAYDAARGEIVLFGGSPGDGVTWATDQTWVWNGVSWTQRFPTRRPPPRSIATMAYDQARGEVVLFGGWSFPSPAYNDTWVWDGSNWTERSPTHRPSERIGHAMAYDAVRRQVVLFGGNGLSCTDSMCSDTWVWDGSDWTQKFPANSPPRRYCHGAAFDAPRGEVVMFGGNNFYEWFNDTWVWDGANWSQKSPPISPPGRGTALEYDAANGYVLLFGGEGASWNDTWVWNGVTWSEKAPATRPPALASHAIVYDEARQELVLYGWYGTWSWGNRQIPSFGGIAGTVTDIATGAPLANVAVCTYTSVGTSSGCVTTSASGAYAKTGLPAGTYYLKAVNSLGYVDELYNNVPCPRSSCSVTSGTGVSVTAGATTVGVNFGLMAGSSITGTVTDALTGAPLVHVQMYVYFANGYLLDESSYTDGWGRYAVDGLPTGTYYLLTENTQGYLDELYDNISCPTYTCTVTTGTGVRVAAGVTTTGINFTLIRRNAGADFTGDTKSDILWRHSAYGDVWIWPMNGAAKLSERYVATVADTDWEIRGQGDLIGDGSTDVLWRNETTGMVYYWRMSGLVLAAETYVATVETAYDILGTGDFDGDGKADLLWRNPAVGDLWIWLMNGAAVRNRVYVATVDPTYKIMGIGDLTGDGKADLVWAGATGDVWVWPMNGTTAVSHSYVGTVPDLNYQIQQVADFDGNGKTDLLWWNRLTGEVWIWLMNGTLKVSENCVGVVPDTNYWIVGAGDYDGNGKADILWHHSTRGEVWVWLMDGATRLSQTWVGTVPDVRYQVQGPRPQTADTAQCVTVIVPATAGGTELWPPSGTPPISTRLFAGGRTVTIAAWGTISIFGTLPSYTNGPNGYNWWPDGGEANATFLLGDWLAPGGEASLVAGGLVGQVDFPLADNPFVYFGASREVSGGQFLDAGVIVLGVNDIAGWFSDNVGSFTVRVCVR